MKRPFFCAVIIASAALIASCHSSGTSGEPVASQAVLADTAGGSCPYLTHDATGHAVLSWIGQRGADSVQFCYAVSNDEGATFSLPVAIPASGNVLPHGENMPKIIFKPSGEIIAAWGAGNPNPKNKYSGLVYYSQSFDNGHVWSKPRSLTLDTASFDQRYFDLALLPGGEVGIVWLDNRKTGPGEGSGLYYAVTKGREGFIGERLISAPCCQCCRTDLFIDGAEKIHVLYRAIINDTIRDMVHIVSADGGKSFSQPQRISKDNWVISGCPHTGPAMAENSKGMHFTWFTGGASAGIYYNTSADGGGTFSPRDSVSGRSAMHCQIASLPNNRLLIVWNENFVQGSEVSSRIGLEERDAGGKRISKQYITPVGGHASFPVLYPVKDGKVLVAYTETSGEQEHVSYCRVQLQ